MKWEEFEKRKMKRKKENRGRGGGRGDHSNDSSFVHCSKVKQKMLSQLQQLHRLQPPHCLCWNLTQFLTSHLWGRRRARVCVHVFRSALEFSHFRETETSTRGPFRSPFSLRLTRALWFPLSPSPSHHSVLPLSPSPHSLPPMASAASHTSISQETWRWSERREDGEKQSD